jgi:hypothetical protein
MASVQILEEVEVVTTTESVTVEKMLITALAIVVATTMEHAKVSVEKHLIHVEMIVDVTLMRYVSPSVEKPMATVKIVQGIVEETTHAQEGGWASMGASIPSQALTVPANLKDPIGLGRNALALVLYRI